MRGARLGSVALLASLTLVACQDDPVGPVDPTKPTPTVTTPPTPTGPTPPPLPDAARAKTAAGAIAFATHWIDLLNLAAGTGETRLLRAASRNCKGCDSYAVLYEKTYADGGYFRRADWVPVAPFADVSAPPAVVLMDIAAPATKYKQKATDPEKVGPSASYKLRFELTWGTSGWIVTRLTEQPTEP